MGKHTAARGAEKDPIVAAALAGRHGDGRGAHSAATGGENPVGWPAPPAPGGGGLGWPADAGPAPAEQEVRSSRRRLFGVGGVA